MTCPKCNKDTTVLDTVHSPDNETYRLRVCKFCGHKFYTAEFEVEANKEFKKVWNRYYRKKENSSAEN